MKLFKKMILVMAVCLCVFMVDATSLICYAQETEAVEPRMTYIAAYSTTLSISDSGLATIKGEVRGKSDVTSSYVNVMLQKYVSGTWVVIKDWEKLENNNYAIVSVSYPVDHGTYRVVMVCRANSETKTMTSAERSY